MKRISIFVLLCVFVFMAGAAWAEDEILKEDFLTKSADANGIIDLKGKTYTLNKQATLSESSKAITLKNGTIKTGQEEKAGIVVGSGCTLTLEDKLTIEEATNTAIEVKGKLVINKGATVKHTADSVNDLIIINGSAQMEMNGGTLTSAYDSTLCVQKSQAKVTINGGTIESSNQHNWCTAYVYDDSEIILIDGTVKSANDAAIVAANGKVTIKGGSVQGGPVGIVAHSHSSENPLGQVIIENGTFKGTKYSVSDNANSRQCYRGSNGFYTAGTVKITKGIFSMGSGITKSDDIGIYVDDKDNQKFVISGNYIYVNTDVPSTNGGNNDTGGGSGGGTAPVEEENKTVEEQNTQALEDLKTNADAETTNAIDAAEEALSKTETNKVLSKQEVEALVQNQNEIAQEKTTESSSGEVTSTTAPAASDLLTDTSISALDNLSAAPKATEPDRPTDSEQAEIVANLSAANLNNVDADSKKDIPADFDPSEIQQATEENLTIDALTKSLADQAELIQDLFNVIKDFLTRVIVNNENQYGVVLSTRMPTLRPHTTGYFPMKMNMRNLVPGQRPRFWASTDAFKAAASSGNSAQKADVSLAADDKEGSAFFIDSNGNPTSIISGDASKMMVVPYLKADTTYDSAFITVDAMKADKEAIEALAAQEQTTTEKDSTSSSSSGGCEAGLGVGALAALTLLMKNSKKR